jgi:hypothetical protein
MQRISHAREHDKMDTVPSVDNCLPTDAVQHSRVPKMYH